MRVQEFAGRPAPLRPQERHELPFGIELGGSSELGQHVALYSMCPHVSPSGALTGSGIDQLAQERNHAELLRKCRIERNLIDAIENLRSGARGFRPLGGV